MAFLYENVMRLRVVLIVLSFALVVATLEGDDESFANHADGKFEVFPIDKSIWKDGPPSLPKGAQIAVLEGDLSKEGVFRFEAASPKCRF